MLKRVAVFILLAGMAGEQLLSRTPGAPAGTTRPTTKPAQPEKYPSAKLVAACGQKAKALRGRLDATFTVLVSPPFVVAGNIVQAKLRQYAQGSVVRPAKAMWAAYFRQKPTDVITVMLFADAKSYKTWARRLYGDRQLPHFGYYRPGTRTMVMNIATGTGTLVHELTHALIAYDFPGVPNWFNEGLASLHEQCYVRKDDIVGLANWRLPALQKVIREGKLRPLRELVTKRDFYGARQGLNYAQARYFVMYMQKKGVLKGFYRHFRDRHAGREADVKAIERVFGKKIGDVEKAYLAWVKTLRYPAR